MEPIPIRHFINDILSGFKNRNTKKLRKLHDVILKETVIYFSKPRYELAVLSYVLSKLVSKPRFLKHENIKILRKIEVSIQELAKNVEKYGENQFLTSFNLITKSILEVEERDSRFVTDLVYKGRIKAAAILYAQGVSLGVSSDMTGVDKQDIQNYAGKTRMFDRLEDEMDMKDRVKVGRRILGEWHA